MKPEYERYRGERGAPKAVASARIPKDFKGLMELVAKAEGDDLSGLLAEGLARVLEDRLQDPELLMRVQEVVDTEAQAQQIRVEEFGLVLGAFHQNPSQ